MRKHCSWIYSMFVVCIDLYCKKVHLWHVRSHFCTHTHWCYIEGLTGFSNRYFWHFDSTWSRETPARQSGFAFVCLLISPWSSTSGHKSCTFAFKQGLQKPVKVSDCRQLCWKKRKDSGRRNPDKWTSEHLGITRRGREGYCWNRTESLHSRGAKIRSRWNVVSQPVFLWSQRFPSHCSFLSTKSRIYFVMTEIVY